VKLKKILDKLLEIYFLGMGVFFVFGSVVSFFVFLSQKVEVGLITPVKTLVFGLLFLYSGVSLMRKKAHGYQYCLLALAIVFLVSTLHRLFFVTSFRLERVDFNNLLLFGIPFLVTLLSNKLEI